MTIFQRPVQAWIPSDWADHRYRTPPSTEPGTDYACPYGTDLVAIADGRVHDVKYTNSGAMGRAMFLEFEDGSWSRYLHLSGLWLPQGATFRRGEKVAVSGGSAGGSNHGVGAHLHLSFWQTPGYMPIPGYTMTNDFEAFLASPAGGGGTPFPDPEEDDVPISDDDIKRIVDGFWKKDMGGGAPLPDGRQVPTETAAERLRQIRRSTFGGFAVSRALLAQQGLTRKQLAAIEAALIQESDTAHSLDNEGTDTK